MARTLQSAEATPGTSTSQEAARNQSGVDTSTTMPTTPISTGSTQLTAWPRQ